MTFKIKDGLTLGSFTVIDAAGNIIAPAAITTSAAGGFNIPGTTSGSIKLVAAATAGSTQITFPAVSGTVALTSDIVINNGVLTLATAGSGISGSGSFSANTSSNVTFTVTSNATSTNTVSTIVLRDGSGNFSAGTITAALAGNASTASRFQGTPKINGVDFTGLSDITIPSTTANSVTAGSYLTGGAFNGSAPITFAVDATSANTASKVVARDGSGNFSAGTITANLTGTASNASAISSFPITSLSRLVANTATGTPSDSNYWAKLATFTTGTNQNAESQYLFAVTTGETGSHQNVILSVFIRTNGSGVNPTCSVHIIGKGGGGALLADDSFKLISGAWSTDIELWLQKKSTYGRFNLTLLGSTNIGFVTETWHQNAAWQLAEPTGAVNNIKTSGITYSGGKVWHENNDGAGSGLDADLLDGISSGSFLRSDTSTTFSNGLLTVNTAASALGSFGAAVNTLQIFQPTAGTDAFQSFYVGSDYALHFGLDGTTNDLFVGGWSAGAVKHKIWHAGNDGAGSGLDADLLDGQSGAYYLDWANVTNKPDPVITVTLTGDVTGTANTTLTDLASGTISIGTTIAANSIALGTDTTGSYVAVGAVAGNGLSGSANAETATFTVTSNATKDPTGNTIVFRDPNGDFSARIVTATLSGNASSASWAPIKQTSIAEQNNLELQTVNTGDYWNEAGYNIPVPSGSGNSQWWNTFTMGSSSRTTQIASQAYSTGAGIAPQSALYVRSKHDGGWGAWQEIINATHTQTLSNKTLSSCTISGTLTGSISGNADTVDGQHFNWVNDSNTLTYVWGATTSGNCRLMSRADMKVGYCGTADNATQAYSKAESALSVSYAANAGNTTNMNNKAEGSLSVNYANSAGSAGSAGTATRANAAYQLEAFTADNFTGGGHFVKAIRGAGWDTRLWMCYDMAASSSNSVSVAYADSCGTAGNSTLAYGKGEGSLYVARAVLADNATQAYGKGESSLSVNYAANAPWGGISSKPSTLGGYGITDAATSGHTHTSLGACTFSGAVSTQALTATSLVVGNTGITEANLRMTCLNQQSGNYFWKTDSYALGYYSDSIGHLLLLDYNGNLTLTGNVAAYSDERLKKDWLDLSPTVIEDIAKIKSGTYSKITGDTKRQVGVSAQDLQKIIPEAVQTDTEGMLSVNYGNVSLSLIVELSKKIIALEAEINKIKGI